MKTRLLILSILIFLTACEKDANVSLPAGNNEIVLNALMNTDSIIYARLTLLNPGLSTTFREPDSADLQLYENGVFKEMLSVENRNGLKFYKSTITATHGNEYKITARVGSKNLEGSDAVPRVANITDLKLSQVPGVGNTGETRINVTLNDNRDEHNYYRFRLYTFDNNTLALKNELFHVNATTNHNNIYTDDYYKSYFMNDALFDGIDMPYVLTIDGLADSVLLEVTALTEASYKYLKSAAAASERSNNIFDESVPVFCNVKNGLGIVGGIAVKKAWIR